MSAELAKMIEGDIQTLKPAVFVDKWFGHSIPHVFGTDMEAYLAFKREFGNHIGVSTYDLMIIGSAATGVSLKPSNKFSKFTADSDVDLAVVSSHYFDVGWRWMRALGAARYSLPPEAQSWIREHETRLVYWGAIATDQILHHMPFGPIWIPCLADLSGRSPIDGRDLTVRIYRDFGSLQGTLIHTVGKCAAGLRDKKKGSS